MEINSNMAEISERNRAKQLFHNKKNNEDFKYFTDRGVDYFVEWFLKLDKRCCYCGIEEFKLRELFMSGRLSTKRKRGRSLELERIDSKSNLYNEANCKLACYFCNNHKSDIISGEEHVKYFSSSIRAFIDNLYGQPPVVTDSTTNFLYLSDQLPLKYPTFFQAFSNTLAQEGIEFDLLRGTNDIWAVDYMPIQVSNDRFVQFTYNPDYLRNYKTYRKTITDTSTICRQIGISPIVTDIIIDGGNVVRSKERVIMTSKVFKENPHYTPNKLVDQIENLLGLKTVIIPTEPKDWIGHADGMVRFLNEDTVLVNDYSKEKDIYYTELLMVLRNAGLQAIPVPYNPYNNPNDKDATGIYINYLQMEGKLFVPVFGLKEDEQALRQFEELFDNHVVVPVVANEVAKQGGVLNCVTWNIMK